MNDRRERERRKQDYRSGHIKAAILGGLALLIGFVTIPLFLDMLAQQGSSMNWIALMLFIGLFIGLFIMMYIAARIARKG